MAKGYLPLPDGSYVTVRDDETPEQAFARARKEYPEAFEVERAPAKPKEGVLLLVWVDLSVRHRNFKRLEKRQFCRLKKQLVVA
jgi:hypothetical protein